MQAVRAPAPRQSACAVRGTADCTPHHEPSKPSDQCVRGSAAITAALRTPLLCWRRSAHRSPQPVRGGAHDGSNMALPCSSRSQKGVGTDGLCACCKAEGGLTAAEVPAAWVGGWPTGVSVCVGRVALTAPYGGTHCKGIDSTSTSQACGPPRRVRLPTLPRTALIAISRTQTATQVRPEAYSLALSALPVRAGTAHHSV